MEKLKDKRKYSNILFCPICHGRFFELNGQLRCEKCTSLFAKNKYGFIDFITNNKLSDVDVTTEEYADIQMLSNKKVYKEYLIPYLSKEPFKKILDVGCSLGGGISSLYDEGYEAYGIDLPGLAKHWAKKGRDPDRFFCCDAIQLPFKNNYFDVVFSSGVIEHIGTQDGRIKLADNYWEMRQRFANELLRVTKPNGRIIISCPNKAFPVDLQHGTTMKNKLIQFLSKKTRISLHPISGRYFLLSYSEINRLFCDNGGARKFKPLRLKGYFGFVQFNSGPLKYFKLWVEFYLNNLPVSLLSTVFNPYILVEIRK